jgi:hypothetical protein
MKLHNLKIVLIFIFNNNRMEPYINQKFIIIHQIRA